MSSAVEIGITLEAVNELREFGNRLLGCETLERVVDVTYQKIEYVLRPQVISLYLFSKDGTLKRFRLKGLNLDGKEIQEDWLKDEQYLPGESFSGRAAAPQASSSVSPYGRTYYDNKLESKANSFSNGSAYKKKLGSLKCGVSVPLNGTHRTFGTLEVLNKATSLFLNTTDVDILDRYESSEICWLTILGGHLSAAISRIRRKGEDRIYTNVSRKLADPDNRKIPSEKVYKSITDQFTGELTPYKVCILRECHGQKLFVIERSCTLDVSFEGKGFEPRDTEGCLVGEVYRNRQHIIIGDIDKEAHRFNSYSWINKQNLKSFIGFPLAIQGEVVGTISLFAGYVHQFTKNDIEFLENISYLLAAYIVGTKRASDAKSPLFEWHGETVTGLSPKDNRVLTAVSDPNWDFRTIQGISRETSISEPMVKRILEKYIGKYVRISLVPSSQGTALYTTISRRVTSREKLALVRTFISKARRSSEVSIERRN